MKKTASLFFSILMVFPFCGKSPNGKSDSEKNISFLHYFSGALSGGIDDMIKVFNSRNPQYRLEATPLDHESFKTSIRETLKGDNPPDIYSYWAGARVSAIVDKLEPIDDIWAKENLSERFSSGVIADACTYNGKKYFVPITQHYVAIFYNKEIFAKLGIAPPKTWNQFIAACAKLKAAHYTPIVLGAKSKWPAQFWFDYILLRTAPIEFRNSLLSGKASYTDPKVLNAFRIWSSLIRNGYFNNDPNSADWDREAIDLFANGKAAMMLMGTWITEILNNPKMTKPCMDCYDFFAFPQIDPAIPQYALGPIDGLVIPHKALNITGAKDVLAFLADIEAQKAMSKGSGALAPNIKVPSAFYSDLQNRILTEIKKSPGWAFNYDLATPPPNAELGLSMFSEFLEFPNNYPFLLGDLQKQMQKLRDEDDSKR